MNTDGTIYWQVTVKIKTEDDKGKVKKTTEQYLVDAVSATDAEAKIYKDFESDSLEFEVTGVRKSNIIRVIE